MRILAACGPGEIRAAAWDGTLHDYAIHRPGAPDGVGDTWRGRVLARLPALAGSFVAIGGTEGFLPDSEATGAPEGTSVCVRITRAAQGGKGPRLTMRGVAQDAGEPGRLARGPGAVERLAALHPDAPIDIDDAAALAALRPALGARLTLVPRAFGPEADDAVAALAEPQAMLPGGARMHVHPTAAVTAIDLDLAAAAGARAAKRAAHEDANRAALPALARQIRLRNLGGAIIVDLAGLSPKRRAAFGPALQAALAPDPLHPRFLGFSALGFAEILRPRVHPPLHELLAGPHAAGLAALRELARAQAAAPAMPLALHAPPAVAAALRADAAAQADMLRLTGRALRLADDPALSSCRIASA